MLNLTRIICLSLLSISSYCGATDYYVNDSDLTGDVYTTSVGSNSNSGTSASSPKATLSNLLASHIGSFNSGDVIYVDAGTYFTTDANLSFGSSLNGVSIVGAGSLLTFFDNNSTSTDANRWANVTGSNITIQGIFLTGYNYGLGGASTLNFSGANNITITDVQVNENSSGGGASAIVISGGSIIDFVGGGSNCNPASSSVAGGGVNVEGNGNIVSFTDYSITGNAKSLQGGSGIYISGDNTTFVTVTNSRISDNVNTSSQGGAAVYLSGANLTISGSCIEGNATHSGSGPKYGGAITLTRGSTFTASNCNFSNNSVANSGKGGAISINTSFSGSGSAASANLTSCNFNGNTATSEGNHIYLRVGSGNAASVVVDECTFSSTSQDIRQDNSGTVTVTNSGTSLSLSGSNTTNNNIAPMTVANTLCPASTVPCFSLLSVELVEFYSVCENGSTTLIWTTASEVNNDYFLLEKVNADGSFTTVTTVNGSDDSQNEITYSYSDHQTREEITYYRLSQVDYDGTREVFDIISSKLCSTSNATTVHYSQETGELMLFNYSGSLENLSGLSLVSMVGNQVATDDVSLQNASKASVQLLKPLAAGNYLVRLLFNDREEMVKLFVH
ncbi:MAG: hypothetical protein P8P74_16890 [Crocinitomicaceae bacterium]|nr:hypothetical protein [Crocinitomicaceae bacterium]